MPIAEIRPGHPRVTIAGLMGLVAVAALSFGAPWLIGHVIVLGSLIAVLSAAIALARGERLTSIEWFVAASGATILITQGLPQFA